MLASLRSAALFGLDAIPVDVEVDVTFGLPALVLVGLPDASVRESRDRVRSAIRNSGYEFPLQRVTVNLAPADVRKAGTAFDLPIALGVLAATGVVTTPTIADTLIVGELSLDGSMLPTRGALSVAALARHRGFTRLVLPAANAAEAEMVAGLTLLPADSLSEAVEVLNDPTRARPRTPPASATAGRRGTRPVRRPRPAPGTAGARDCRGRRPQPADDRPAGCGQDDAGAAPAGPAAATGLRRGAGSDDGPFGGRVAARQRRTDDAPARFGRRITPSPTRPWWAAAACHGPARSAWRTTACSSSTRRPNSTAARWKCCASRSSTAPSSSRARRGRPSSRHGSRWSPP